MLTNTAKIRAMWYFKNSFWDTTKKAFFQTERAEIQHAVAHSVTHAVHYVTTALDTMHKMATGSA